MGKDKLEKNEETKDETQYSKNFDSKTLNEPNSEEASGLIRKKEEEKPFLNPEELSELFGDEKSSNKTAILKAVSHISRSFGVMEPQNPLTEKITSEHIGKIIDNDEKQSVREDADKKDERKYNIWLIIIVLTFSLILTYFLIHSNHTELIEKILILVMGFVGGFGYGKYGQKKKE